MKSNEYLPLKVLSIEQERRPGVFPIFKKIRGVDGELIGEDQEFSDEFGNRY